MRFDEFLDDDAGAPAKAATADLPLPADGRHAATVVAAEEKDLSFKAHPKNPGGRSLVATLQVAGCRPVEDITPAHLLGVVRAICRAARVEPPKRGVDWDPAQLIGAQVQIETTLSVAQGTGREYVRVKWIAGPPGVAPTRVERAVAPPARSNRPQLAEDDIPF